MKNLTYGWVPEWPKGADCKSVSNAFGGSNPPPSIDAAVAELADAQDLKSCGTYTPVPVRFRFAAVRNESKVLKFQGFALFFIYSLIELLYSLIELFIENPL